MSSKTLGPPLGLMTTEPVRAVAELGLLAPGVLLLRRAPAGDGKPVMVLPGMGAGEWSTAVMRGFLSRRNHAVYGWGQGTNSGSLALLEPLLRRVSALRRRHGARVGLVGWSLGGVYAREIARLVPEDVRCVITLASPFRGPPEASNVGWIYTLLSGRKPGGEGRDFFAAPPSVPATAIFTRSDGVVPWQRCVEEAGARTENIEVWASHMGMGHNALALYATADRLVQSPETWQPFRAPRALRALYPEKGDPEMRTDLFSHSGQTA